MSQKLKGIAQRFCRFREEFGTYFQTKTRNGSAVAEKYLAGLIQSTKRNMERMGEKVPDSCEQSFQHFITNSPWDERPLMARIAYEVNMRLGAS